MRVARLTPALFAAAVIAVLAIYVRLVLFPFESNDYTAFFARWYDFIKANGGLPALRYQFADYNVPYLYLIALLTYLPVPVLAGIKVISVLFDLLLAFFTYKLVALKYPAGWKPFVASATVVLLPTVVTNSAMWGQCDSIYASLGLGGVYFALRSRPYLACVFFGLSLAFKLQPIFILPAVLVLVLLKKLPWAALLAIPGVVLALDIPALLVGADPGQLLSVYTNQVGEYTQLTLNAPNAYQFLSVQVGADLIRSAGVWFTGALVFVVILLSVIRRVPLTATRVVHVATLFAILVPFFLPAMHERYFYLAEVLSVILAFYVPRLWAVPLLVQFASFLSYVPFLFGSRGAGTTAVDFKFLAVTMLVALVLVVREFVLDSQVQLNRGQSEQQERPAAELTDHVRLEEPERSVNGSA